jgi:hypothetical protein
VQDLYALYTRFGPAGPHRCELFHDAPTAGEGWPPQLLEQAGELDELLRSAACLLANNLSSGVPPVLLRLWQSVRQLERGLSPASAAEPEYYRYLQRDLESATAGPALAYRLFGEVLAVYLDVLSCAHPPFGRQLGGRVAPLRRALLYAGDSSSGPTA